MLLTQAAQSAIPVLSRQRAAEIRHELHRGQEDALHPIPPPGVPQVQERVHVQVAVAGVAEDHGIGLMASENLL